MPARFLLTVTESDGCSRGYRLAPGSYVIGREPDCDIVVESSNISRRHVRLTLNEDELSIEDLGSRTGTMVQNLPVSHGPQRWPYPQFLSLGSVGLDVRELDASAEVPLTVMGADPNAGVPFEFGNEIARGGMGSIIEADDRKLGRKIAVKVMLLESGADDPQRQRFVQEAAVLGRLEHPNIVPIHDLGRDSEGQLYYTMKLVKGRTLQAIIDDLHDETPGALQHYTLAHLLTIFRKVCDAVAFAHSKGIIHRDLKPENVMVGEFGEVLVMDWGLAKILGKKDEDERMLPSREVNDENSDTISSAATPQPSSFGSTMVGDVMGTPFYMPPEQAEGRVADLDAQSDIWSLGGVLYCILTLHPPVSGTTLDEILQKVIRGSITPLNSQAKRGTVIPPALASVAMKALSVNKAKRYPNVAALSADIEAYQNGFATSAEHAGAWRQFTLLVKRHQAASIGVAALWLVGGVLGSKALLEGQRATRALLDLRRTAPVFYAQAKVDFEEGNLDAAIEKIGYAIQLNDSNADYHLFRANLRESSQDLTAATADYHSVLALRPADAAARTNLALCEKLLRETDGAPLGRAQQSQLLIALREQKRLIEAAPLAAIIDPDIALARSSILARLREVRKLPGWSDRSIATLPDGTFKISLISLAPIDFSVLRGEPVSVLNLGRTGIADLSSLAGLPLKELNLYGARATDLSPLRGMPLENLVLDRMPASDLSPLRGMKLRILGLSRTGAGDLSPLAGMPLTDLNCSESRNVSDLSPLRGAPLKHLDLSGTNVTKLTPLNQVPGLEELTLGRTAVKDLSPLVDLHLTILDCGDTGITSIAALRGQPLRFLNLLETSVTDMSPLAGCNTLGEIILPAAAGDVSMLRKLPRLKLISTRRTPTKAIHAAQTAAEFWKEYDAKQAAGKK